MLYIVNSSLPVDWVIACMVPLYKGKGDVHECSILFLHR